MAETKSPDFSGWATKYNIKCKDNRTIMPGAFQHCDGAVVPMVYMHSHNNIDNVLGKAVLSHKAEGVWADCWVNSTSAGQNAKELVQHGDITAFSIYADGIQENYAGVVSHGDIKELSLVLSGANSGATIENVIRHDDITGNVYTDESAMIFKLADGEITISHADDDSDDKKDDKKEETIKDVIDSMTEKQRNVMEGLIGAAIMSAQEEVKHSDMEDDYEGGNEDMYNVLEGNAPTENVLSHSDMQEIFADARRIGSLRETLNQRGLGSPKIIAHSIDNLDYLYPEARNLNNPPAWVKRPTEWVSKVMNGVKHIPFAKFKSVFADITEEDARAKGYIKGNLKKEEVFTLLRRQTEPTTVYKKQSMDRDDWIDITDFDTVVWLKSEMRMMLDEEIARAMLIGDGRSAASEDKINETHIRPIAFDDDFYSLKVPVSVSATATDNERAKTFIRSVIKSRKNYRGSGNPTAYMTEDLLADLLLIEDANGRFIYESMEKLKGVLRVSDIVTVPVMDGLTTTDGSATIDAIIVNLSDYTSGADKGGAVNMFDDFDIDYNKMKYLIETRCSGALTVPASAMVFQFPTRTAAAG